MAHWVRDGAPPEKLRVSFEIQLAKHPELVEWLWSLPNRNISASLRDALALLAREGKLPNPAQPAAPVAVPETVPASMPPRVVLPAAYQPVQPLEAVATPATVLDADTLASLRELDRRG